MRIVSRRSPEKGYLPRTVDRDAAARPSGHPRRYRDTVPAGVRAGFSSRSARVAPEPRARPALPPFSAADNLPNNGRLVRGVVLGLARAPGSGAPPPWIEQTVRFPPPWWTAITPATTADDIARAGPNRRPITIPPCVVHEPFLFRQWVSRMTFTDGATPVLGCRRGAVRTRRPRRSRR